MPRPKKYATEEERKRAQYKQKLEYNKRNRGRFSRTLAISMSPAEADRHLALLDSYGYDSPAAFWRVCIKMLENGLLPRNPAPPVKKNGSRKPTQEPPNDPEA